MFYKEGYLTPVDVMNRICEAGGRFGTCICSLNEDELRAYALKQFWIFAKTMDYLYLLDSQGNMIRGSKHLAEPLDGDNNAKYGPVFYPFDGVLMDFRHLKYLKFSWREHATIFGLGAFECVILFYMLWQGVDILIGQVMQFFGLFAYLLFLYHRRNLKKFADESLGQFRGMAVCYSEQQVSDYLALETEDDSLSNDPRSEIEVKDAIIHLLDSGKIVTRARARETVGAKLSSRGFTRAWGLAAMERPSLSTPGRRVGEIKSDYRNTV